MSTSSSNLFFDLLCSASSQCLQEQSVGIVHEPGYYGEETSSYPESVLGHLNLEQAQQRLSSGHQHLPPTSFGFAVLTPQQ
ncbi:hypothetical protein CEXT_435611 [Caerostris extrusa]|uniref:Uncharacterized protein n=1 Tax=Caerostris extrusa TaxID=172846 RepID=A0AAV4UZX1_CAEEX|nr:hypothetical protein CEXT_435611 [Caerostris extrusa]